MNSDYFSDFPEKTFSSADGLAVAAYIVSGSGRVWSADQMKAYGTLKVFTDSLDTTYEGELVTK